MSGQCQAPSLVITDDFRLLNADHTNLSMAALSLSGKLRLPPGVAVSRRQRRCARDTARRLLFAKLREAWRP
jgi:hypothetical protein